MTTADERAARRKRAQAEARRKGNERAAELANRMARGLAEPIDPPKPPQGDQVPTTTQPTAKPGPTKPARKAAERAPAKRSASTATPTKPAHGHEVDLDAAISHMELEFIQCRDFGHSWRPYSARWVPRDNCYESQLRCARCKAIRTRWLSRTGSQIGGGYDYADGYLVKGIGRLSGTDRDKIRLASIIAVLPSDTAEEG